jgi:hypothetical protein
MMTRLFCSPKDSAYKESQIRAVALYSTLCFSLFLSPLSLAREPIGAYSRIESHTYSQVMSIDGFIDNFSDELTNGDTALTHDLAEVGVQYGDWRIGRVLRYDYDLSFSNDTALINYNIENNVPIDSDAAYSIYLAAEHLRSEGFRIARRFKPYRGVTLSVGLSWLNSEQFYSGSVSLQTDRGGLTDDVIAGFESRAPEFEAQAQSVTTPAEAVVLGEDLLELSSEIQPLITSSNFQGSANYAYYRPALREDEQDEFSNVNFSTPSGRGYTFDVSLTWNFHPQWSLALEIRDLYSQITWSDAPQTQAQVSGSQAASDVLEAFNQFVENDVIKRFSGQFFTPTNPADSDNPQGAIPDILARIEADNVQTNVRNEKFFQRIPQQRYMALTYDPISWWSTTVKVETYQTQNFYHIRGDFWQHIAVEWHPTVSAIGLEFYHPLGRLRLATDDFDFQSAKFVSLTASVQLVF